MGYPLCCLMVPAAQNCGDSISDARLQRAEPFGAEVSFALMPDVAHGREAVADMRHAARRTHALGHAMTETYDQIARRQPPALHRCRHKRQEVAVAARYTRQAVETPG